MPLADGLITPPRHILNAAPDPKQIARYAIRLLAARERIDEIMWGDVEQRRNKPFTPDDAVDRLRVATAVGISLKGIVGILKQALSGPDHLAGDLQGTLLQQMVDAYRRIANITVPAGWHPETASLANPDAWDQSMLQAWSSLCELIAEIIGHPPRYGLAVLPPPHGAMPPLS